MASKNTKKKTVTLKQSPSSNIKLTETQSQTDASEWVEYETDMKELYEILKDEGIDVPTDEKGNPILDPQFIQSLPPSVQYHAGGKQYSGGKPFKSTLGVVNTGVIGREIQTRTSIWEDYKKELNELCKKLEKQGIVIPRDEDGVAIFPEDLIKSLPPEEYHPAGKEFAALPGVPPLPDGTRVSPRLTMRLLTPALEVELIRRSKKSGITIPVINGRPTITPEFLRTVPPDLLQKVLKPVYDNQKRLSEKRDSVIRKLSVDKKNLLKKKLEKKGIEVKSTEKGEFIIPTIAVMQFTEDEVAEVVGEEDTRDIFKPAPEKMETMPDDVLTNLSTERRQTIGKMLHDQGLSVDVDKDNVPIITKTNAGFLPQETLDEMGIPLEEIVGPVEKVDKRKSTESEKDPDRKSRVSEFQRKSRKNLSFRTGRGIFHLTRKNIKDQLVNRLNSAGIEVKMTTEGEIELSHVSEDIVAEFTATIQEELKELDPHEIHLRIHAMVDDDKELLHDHLELAGITVPTDENGSKMITVEFIEKLPRDVLINLLAKLSSSPEKKDIGAGGAEEEEDETLDHQPSHTSGKGTGSDHDPEDDIELELTDEQKEEFYDRLMEEGIRVPLDDATGRPQFTKQFIRSIPKKFAHEIISTAAMNADEEGRRFSSFSDDSDEEEEEQLSKEETSDQKRKSVVLGLRYSQAGGVFMTDEEGQKVQYDNILKYLKNAYSDSELKKHEQFNREHEASLRAAIREERRHEEKDLTLKKASSDVEMQEMAMRFIPEYNPRPDKNDPINLFEHIPRPPELHPPSLVPHKGVEFIHLMEPSLPLGKVDSLATVPSTVARKFSNDTMRGSALSTHLSDMPSIFSQALMEEPSTSTVFVTASSQEFDISPKSVSNYREKWLSSFMSGFTPKQTFTICIINMITRKRVELRVCKENTLNEICHMYMQYEDHPEYYVWKDIHGRLLIPEKTLVENGLMRQDEVLEFQGYRRMPVILLYFRDGFENDPPLPLNPLHALRQRDPGLCRNY